MAVSVERLLAFGSPVRTSSTVHGTCTWVCDGDTVYVQITLFTRIKVRIAGEDAREHGQKYGEESKKFLIRLLYKRKVSVQIVDRDRYGRYVDIVRCENRDAVLEILKAGLAWCYYACLKNLPPHFDSAYKKVAYNAKMNRRGLWKTSKAIAPMVLGMSVLFGMIFWLASQRVF